MATYLSWLCAFGFTALICAVRIIDNRAMQYTLAPAPPWVSVAYLIGVAGLVSTFFWSMFAIAYWACLPVVCIYAMSGFVPSWINQAMRDPRLAHIAAFEQAAEELSTLEPGREKLDTVMERADAIMRARGWTPK